jgi:hypothetical protein
LRDGGKSHRLVERADCDHDMTIESCRIAFFEALEQFLIQSLSGARGF